MSMVVARMQKMKAANLIGLGNHNQRKTDNHSNKDIDVSRSYLNYDLVNKITNYKTDIEKYINENKASSRAVRKDAVLVNEWIISSDSDFFKGLDENQTKQFFQSARNYFAFNYGDSNIRYAQVHMDERTPHMHLGIVPFTEDKRLSAKTVFDRQALQKIQEDLPKHLQKSGFNIERGKENSDKKHLTVNEYKELKDRTNLKELKEIERDLAAKNQTSQSELERTKKEYGKLEQEYGGLIEKSIRADEEVKAKEKELIQFGYRENYEIEKKPVFLKKGYSAVKTSDLEQLEKDAGLSVLAKDKFRIEESKQRILTAELKIAEEKHKKIEQDLTSKLDRALKELDVTRNKLRSVVNDFTDHWEFAKEVFKQTLGKDLGDMYKQFKEKGKEKAQSRETGRDDFSR